MSYVKPILVCAIKLLWMYARPDTIVGNEVVVLNTTTLLTFYSIDHFVRHTGPI